ncbi:MAG TPA: exosortase [Candidatus Dormibacteraeota bacterium]|nr:exosortase [Candidatus Dormibacteraeota bacterium]
MNSAALTPKPANRAYEVLFLGALLLGFVAVLYAGIFAGLWKQWWDDPNLSHGFMVPLVSAYVLWSQRDRLRNVPVQPSNFGLVIVLGGVTMLVAATLSADLWVGRMSFLVVLAGLVLFLAGRRMLRAVAFPLGFLMFMIPLPGILYYQLTFPLQLIASRFATSALSFLHVPITRAGNLLILPNCTLEVAEACSGIRSLFSIVALAVAYGYLFEARLWKRIVLAVLMVPVAVACNGLRLVGTGLISYFAGPEFALGFFHTFSGWLIFLMALALMILASWILQVIDFRWSHARC